MKTARHLAVTVIATVLALSLSVPAKPTIQAAANTTQDSAAPTGAEQEMFTKGQKLYLQGNYTQAAEVLENFLRSYPNSIITDLTLLWLGRSYYQVGKFTEAAQAGKRLRAIKDTPFADIYDSELESARREAASRPSAGVIDNPASLHRQPQQQRANSRAVSLASRNRYAGERATSRSSPTREVTSKATKPPARRPTTAGHLNVGLKSNREVTRQRVNSVPENSKRPASANNTTARARVLSSPYRNKSASDNGVRHLAKANQSSRQPVLSATQHRTTQNRQMAAAKPKPASPLSPLRTGAGNHMGFPGRAASFRKPAPRRSSSDANQSVARNISPRRSRGAANARPAVSEQASLKQSSGRKRLIASGTDNAAPAVLNEPAVTGGLYSMIDVFATSALVGTTPPTLVSVISKRVNAKPGEIVYLSFVVRNSGSAKQTYELRVSAPSAPKAKMYVDSNGDGVHQSDELPVTGSPVVELTNGELSLLLEITVPRDAFEGEQYSYTLTVLSVDKEKVVATATSTLTVSSIRASLLPQNVAGDNVALAAVTESP